MPSNTSTVHGGDTEHHVVVKVDPHQWIKHPGDNTWAAETEFTPDTIAQILGAEPGDTAPAQLSTTHGGITGQQIQHVSGLPNGSMYASQLDFKHPENGTMTPFSPKKNVHVINGTQALQADCVYLPGGGPSNTASYEGNKTPTEEAIHLTNKWAGKDPNHCFLGVHELPADATKDKKARLLVPQSSDVPTNPVSHLIETTPAVGSKLGLLPKKVKHNGEDFHVVLSDQYKEAAEQVKGVLERVRPSTNNTVIRHYVTGAKPTNPIFVHKQFTTGATSHGPRAVTATIPKEMEVTVSQNTAEKEYGLDLKQVVPSSKPEVPE